MAKKRRPGGRGYKRPDFSAEAARLNPEKYGPEKAAEDMQNWQGQSTPIDKPAPTPAKPHVTRPARKPAPAPRARGIRPRYLVAGAAGVGAVGGAAYLIHRSRRRNTVKKGLIDPLTGASFVVEKRYIEDDLDEGTRGVLVAKRSDESAAFHLGRSNGRRTPVSSTRVSGLPIQSASFSRGNPEARPGTRSHANKLTHVRHHQKQHPRGTLLVVRHGGRDKSGSSVGKSTQFGQSSAVGRRIVSAY